MSARVEGKDEEREQEKEEEREEKEEEEREKREVEVSRKPIELHAAADLRDDDHILIKHDQLQRRTNSREGRRNRTPRFQVQDDHLTTST